MVATEAGGSPARRRNARWAALVLPLLASLLGVAGWRGYREFQRRDLVQRGISAYDQGRWSLALRLAREARGIAPRDPSAATLAALALVRLGQVEPAERLFAAGRPLSVPELHLRAEGLIRASKLDAAVAVFEELLHRSPDDTEALRRLAALRMARDEWAPALQLAERLKALPGSEVAGAALAATVLYHLSRMPPAIEEFRRVLMLDPELKQSPLHPEQLFWDRYAHALMLEGRLGEARAVLEQGLARGDDPTLRDRLGQVYWNEGRPDDAETQWRQAVQLGPDRADPWLNLGRLALWRGQPEQAAGYLERAAALAPQSENPQGLLARAYRQLGRDAEAQRALDRQRALRRQSMKPSTHAPTNPPPRGSSDTVRSLNNSE